MQQSLKEAKHLINKLHRSFLKDSLLNFETTSGTDQEFVCCLYVQKVREVFKYLLGPSIRTHYLLLTTTAGEDKIMYPFLTSFMGPSSIVVENT